MMEIIKNSWVINYDYKYINVLFIGQTPTAFCWVVPELRVERRERVGSGRWKRERRHRECGGW